MEKLLVTATEAATMIGIGRTRIYDLIARGQIPSVRIGRSVRVPLTALREWIAAQQAHPIPEQDETATLPLSTRSSDRRVTRAT